MTVNYHNLNRVATPTKAIVLDMISLFEQIKISSGNWYAAMDLANTFFDTC